MAAKDLTLTVGVREVVLYAAAATLVAGKWSVVADTTAAGGARMANPDANAAKVNAALANPVDYFEMTFQAQAGVAYHLWLRGKAEKNTFANDSVFVQFSGSVDARRRSRQPDRHDGRRDGQHRGRHERRPRELGLGRRLVRRLRRRDVLRDHRPAHAPHPGP